MCIVGGICLQYLRTRGITVGAHIYSGGKIKDTPFDLARVNNADLDFLKEQKNFPVLNTEAGEKMKEVIESARADGDSVGGIIECAVVGLPAGIGEPIYDGIENRVAAAVFGIPAVKGIEFGNGFECASLTGSRNNDAILTDGKRI